MKIQVRPAIPSNKYKPMLARPILYPRLTPKNKLHKCLHSHWNWIKRNFNFADIVSAIEPRIIAKTDFINFVCDIFC